MDKLNLNIKKKLLSQFIKKNIISSSFNDTKDYELISTPINTRKAAVLCLLDTKSNDINIILTLRSKNLKDHPGQISFPGGKPHGNETLYDCAIREAYEEIGINKKKIEILGELDMYLSGSNFLIKPVVGLIKERYKIILNEAEVEKVIYFPIKHLFEKNNLTTNTYIDKKTRINKYYYDISWNKIRIWGTTAIILVHLSKIIKSVIFNNV
mgnify:CR=1 FL=1